MDNNLIQKLLQAQSKAKKQMKIAVVGISMNPTLYEGDIITVLPQESYQIGDILVFTYKQGELLVHRLLDIKGENYYCKGDNSFRLEDITENEIIGKVVKVNGNIIVPCSKKLTFLSYLVNRAFFKCRYDIEKTKQTDIYKLYKKIILEKEENIMIYKKNETMDYIQSDETSLAVFDPESGDTHFFDEIGIDILNILSEPCDLEHLLNKLSKIYDVSPQDIKPDVEEFLSAVINKKVVEVL